MIYTYVKLCINTDKTYVRGIIKSEIMRKRREKSKKAVFVVAIIFVVATLILGCAQQQPPTQTPAQQQPPTQTPSPRPVLICGALPLTGALAKNAEKIKMAYEDWAEYINAHGGLLGRRVVLKIYDDEGDITKGTELAEKCITVDRCDFLLPWYEGHVSRAVMPIAEKHKMLYTGMGGHLQSFQQGYEYVVCAPPLMGEWWFEGMGSFLQSLPQDERPKKAYIMTARLTIFDAVGTDIKQWLDKLGIPYKEEVYSLPLKSADSLILNAKDYDADLLILNGLFPDGVLAMKAAIKYNYTPAFIFQSVGSPDPEWIGLLGSKGNYVFTGMAWYPNLPYEGNDLIVKTWKEKHAKKHGEQVPVYYGLGWCWIKTIEIGVKGAKSFDQTQVRDYLKSHTIHSPAGDFNIDRRGIPEPYNYLVQWQNGKLELVWPPEVSTAKPLYPHPPWDKT